MTSMHAPGSIGRVGSGRVVVVVGAEGASVVVEVVVVVPVVVEVGVATGASDVAVAAAATGWPEVVVVEVAAMPDNARLDTSDETHAEARMMIRLQARDLV
jgi:hypothetical protein